jgi:hypothetical protein
MNFYKVFLIVSLSFFVINCGSSTSEEIETYNNSAGITNKSNNKIIQSVTSEPIATEIPLKNSKRSTSSRNRSSATQTTPTPISITVLPTTARANKSSPADKSQSYKSEPTYISTSIPNIATTLPISTPEPTSTILPTASPTPLPIPIKMTNTDSNCEDRKDYVYCTSIEAIVAPLTTLEWGVEKGYSPEVFCASDLQETVCPAVTSSLLAAMIEWGSYEPVEYWVLGTEKEAASVLTNINCERRENRGQDSMVDCLRKHGPEGDHGFDYYRRMGKEAIEKNGINYGSTFANSGDTVAAHMGHDEWGFHFFGSSIPFGFTDIFQPIYENNPIFFVEGGSKEVSNLEGLNAGRDQKTLFHEYFHGIQNSFIQTSDREKRESLLGPDWFVEGAAEYMAQIKYKKSIDIKLLKPIYGLESYELKLNMTLKMMNAVLNLYDNPIEVPTAICPGSKLQDLNYENSCNSLSDLGTWAIAILAHVYGEDLLLKSFYPSLNESPNWEVAFKDTYGLSLEEFYVDFDKFFKHVDKDSAFTVLPTTTRAKQIYKDILLSME